MPPYGPNPFVVIVAMVLVLGGGLALMFPIMNQLTRAVAKRLEGGKDEAGIRDEVERLTETVQSLETQVRSLGEQQAFLEKLLEARAGAPKSDDPGGPR